MAAATQFYAERFGFTVAYADDAGSTVDTDWGTREFATTDNDGNLLTFYERTG